MSSADPDIRYLFEPRSIAVIGASHDPDKLGHKILENIVTGGYQGTIYPVNPKGGEILGIPVLRSIEEIEGEVDVVSTVVPAKRVFDSVKACAKRNILSNSYSCFKRLALIMPKFLTTNNGRPGL